MAQCMLRQLAATLVSASALFWATPAHGQGASSGFPKVYKRMLSAIQGIGPFSATIKCELYNASGKQTVIKSVAYASKRRYRVHTRRTPARIGPAEDLITRRDGLIVVRQTQRDKRHVYWRYELSKMNPEDIPKCSPQELFGVPPLKPDDLKLFAVEGQAELDGEPVTIYVCPPRQRKTTEPAEEIPGLQSGSADKTGRISIWVGARDFLPRRIIMMTAAGKPAIVLSYTNIQLNPRFGKDTFDCRIPKRAYWIDGSAPRKDM